MCNINLKLKALKYIFALYIGRCFVHSMNISYEKICFYYNDEIYKFLGDNKKELINAKDCYCYETYDYYFDLSDQISGKNKFVIITNGLSINDFVNMYKRDKNDKNDKTLTLPKYYRFVKNNCNSLKEGLFCIDIVRMLKVHLYIDSQSYSDIFKKRRYIKNEICTFNSKVEKMFNEFNVITECEVSGEHFYESSYLIRSDEKAEFFKLIDLVLSYNILGDNYSVQKKIKVDPKKNFEPVLGTIEDSSIGLLNDDIYVSIKYLKPRNSKKCVIF